jgi:hypothetical protein
MPSQQRLARTCSENPENERFDVLRSMKPQIQQGLDGGALLKIG